ncbi:MAG: FAD-binding oxidoreductase, partial [Acidimicrobiia bacterium]
MTPTNSTLIRALGDAVGASHVLVEDDVKASYEVDWMRRWQGRSTCVVRPADTGEVARVVSICAKHRTPIVPQGGNTGLVGGSVPGDGEPVVLSLRRMDAISDVDAMSGQVTAGAGATLESVQDAVAGSGWEVGIDLASRASATIGGMVATNAGGIRVLRDGMMRRQVVGLEFVRASGEVVTSMRGLVKDNTGYDLAGLLCGSEGTLGVVTRVTLQLVPQRPHRIVALIPVPDLREAVGTMTAVRPRLPSLEAAEFVSRATLQLVRSHTGLPMPSAAADAAILILEAAGTHDPTDELFAAVGEIPGVVVGIDAASREGLWRYREAATESIAANGVPHKIDVTLPLGRMADFAEALHIAVEEVSPGAGLYLFGHIADGGVHVNVLADTPSADSEIDHVVMAMTAEYGGSISAEHGIGRAKAS